MVSSVEMVVVDSSGKSFVVVIHVVLVSSVLTLAVLITFRSIVTPNIRVVRPWCLVTCRMVVPVVMVVIVLLGTVLMWCVLTVVSVVTLNVIVLS
jgi:hypothetical protein